MMQSILLKDYLKKYLSDPERAIGYLKLSIEEFLEDGDIAFLRKEISSIVEAQGGLNMILNILNKKQINLGYVNDLTEPDTELGSLDFIYSLMVFLKGLVPQQLSLNLSDRDSSFSDVVSVDTEERKVDDENMEQLAPKIIKNGYLEKSDLITVSHWCSSSNHHRNLKYLAENDTDSVETITRTSFLSGDEIQSLNNLLGLKGVGFSVGSSILHWFHNDEYPIWNSKYLRRTKFNQNEYPNQLESWKGYVYFCREFVKSKTPNIGSLDIMSRKALYRKI